MKKTEPEYIDWLDPAECVCSKCNGTGSNTTEDDNGPPCTECGGTG